MDEKLTIKQVLMMTRDMLKNIGTIPIEEAEHIGIPVISAIRNLEVCINAFNEGENQMEEEAKEVNNGNADAE